MIYTVIDKICYIPLDANSFISSSREYGPKMQYKKEHSITDVFFGELNFFVFQHKDQWDYIVLDMKNISSASSRRFESLTGYLDKLILCNIVNERMRDIVYEDIPNVLIKDNHIFPKSIIDNAEFITNVLKKCAEFRSDILIGIIKKLAIEKKEWNHLESSGLYSNYYINIKRLFLEVENFQYIVFMMAGKLQEKMETYKIDSLVTSSKNGAIIAYVLGGLLDIKEVHLIGIGPKYAMQIGDSVDCIRSGKRYAYIYDFMCTGTEAKIVSALVNSKKAFLPYALGIANYRSEIQFYPVNEIEYLVSTKMMSLNYIISGEKVNE